MSLTAIIFSEISGGITSPVVPARPLMSFSAVVLLFCAGGALGGLAEFFKAMYLDNNSNKSSTTRNIITRGRVCYRGFSITTGTFFLILFASAIIGVAGAIAIQFLLVLLGAARFESGVEELVFNLSISAAAGFGARVLLPDITKRISEEFIDKKAREEAEDALEIATSAQFQSQKSIMYQRVNDVIESNEVMKIESLMIELKDLIKDHPDERSFNIWLARLHRAKDEINLAVGVLKAFVSRKKSTGNLDDDLAAALYNLACYYAVLDAKPDTPAYFEKCIECLKEAIELSPDNKSDAKTDRDFSELRDREEFKKLIDS